MAIRGSAAGVLRFVTHGLGARALRVTTYALVSATVLSLPMLGAGLPAGSVAASMQSAVAAPDDLVADATRLEDRAATVSRARVLSQQRNPLTVNTESPQEVRTYTVEKDENLVVIAAKFGVTPLTIAYNNGVTDAQSLHPGDVFRIPPFDGAIYKVRDGDTVESVAAHFKVEAKAIRDTNRLYFEPENFQTGKEVLVPVPKAEYPNFELKDASKLPPAPYIAARPVAQPLPVVRPANARLAWPVGGVLTQYFWYGHKGVDIAAPYGRGIAASDAGTVSAVGWVAVGGLRVCVKHDWGMETCYYHSSATHVTVGQRVEKGTIVASIGLTGLTTGPHVHWEARLNGVLVNPLAY